MLAVAELCSWDEMEAAIMKSPYVGKVGEFPPTKWRPRFNQFFSLRVVGKVLANL